MNMKLIPLELLNKKKDGRMKNVMTFKNNDQVFKVYEAKSPMLKVELAILKTLAKYKMNNIVKYICDFSCKDPKIEWNNETNGNILFCDGSGKLHFIVLEYISNGDIGIFFKNNSLNDQQFTSFLKQLMFCVIELYKKYKIRHCNLHSGNILIDIDSNNVAINEYRIGNKTYAVHTLGVEPILIDFGRANKSCSSKKSKTSSNSSSTNSNIVEIDDINWLNQEVLIALEVVKYCLNNIQQKQKIDIIINDISKFGKSQLYETLEYIMNIL
jgi:prepilin-type processing-associated H-X9-DG protein